MLHLYNIKRKRKKHFKNSVCNNFDSGLAKSELNSRAVHIKVQGQAQIHEDLNYYLQVRPMCPLSHVQIMMSRIFLAIITAAMRSEWKTTSTVKSCDFTHSTYLSELARPVCSLHVDNDVIAIYLSLYFVRLINPFSNLTACIRGSTNQTKVSAFSNPF